ncbi:hypothetical protein [Deinococcus sonorensis]|uniref:YkuD domain-containing protein n=2 Tax=Deinococcus sonorensis TaxID=309891 RepID=A0AAU7UHG9_9DEIO
MSRRKSTDPVQPTRTPWWARPLGRPQAASKPAPAAPAAVRPPPRLHLTGTRSDQPIDVDLTRLAALTRDLERLQLRSALKELNSYLALSPDGHIHEPALPLNRLRVSATDEYPYLPAGGQVLTLGTEAGQLLLLPDGAALHLSHATQIRTGSAGERYMRVEHPHYAWMPYSRLSLQPSQHDLANEPRVRVFDPSALTAGLPWGRDVERQQRHGRSWPVPFALHLHPTWGGSCVALATGDLPLLIRLGALLNAAPEQLFAHPVAEAVARQHPDGSLMRLYPGYWATESRHPTLPG